MQYAMLNDAALLLILEQNIFGFLDIFTAVCFDASLRCGG